MAYHKDRPAIVYQATNLINGNRYIGVTGRSLKERAAAHWHARHKTSGFLLPRAMGKYGRDMFLFTVLKSLPSSEEALKEEVRLIALLRPEYNLSAGGDGAIGFVVSEKGRSDRAKRIGMMGGKIWAAAAAAHRKAVICLKDGKTFSSCSEAARHYGLTPSAITLVLSGKNATAAGMLFGYFTGTETALPDHDERVNKIRCKQRAKMVANTARRPVMCLTNGDRYQSLGDASKSTGVPYGCLARILGRRGLKSWHGLKFEYAS